MSDLKQKREASSDQQDSNNFIVQTHAMCQNVILGLKQGQTLEQASKSCKNGPECPFSHSFGEQPKQTPQSRPITSNEEDKSKETQGESHARKSANLDGNHKVTFQIQKKDNESVSSNSHSKVQSKSKGKRRESANVPGNNESPVALDKDKFRRRSDAPKHNRQLDDFDSNDQSQDGSGKQSRHEGKEEQVCYFLDLTLFKVQPCKQDTSNHNLKRCPYYHDQKKDQRRPLGTYQAEFCKNILKTKECVNKEKCQKAHNRVEEFYHPDKYKAKFCSSYIKKSECEYGEYCSFAHSEAEISVELIDKFKKDIDFYMFHFKTVWCPYNEDDHKRDICVFAHNWQDYRRKPQIALYKKEQCNNWSSQKTINDYKEGCKTEFKCELSHGWKEQEYHPEFYKLNLCKHGDGCNKPHCPYYHNESDRRQQPNQWFRVFPKTRLVNFQSNYYAQQLRNLTLDQDFMGGLKETSFSKAATDIHRSSPQQTQGTQFNMKVPQFQQQQNQSQMQPYQQQMMTHQSMQNVQAQQNFNINAASFVPQGQNNPHGQYNERISIHSQQIPQNYQQWQLQGGQYDPTFNKRVSQSPVVYQNQHNQYPLQYQQHYQPYSQPPQSLTSEYSYYQNQSQYNNSNHLMVQPGGQPQFKRASHQSPNSYQAFNIPTDKRGSYQMTNQLSDEKGFDNQSYRFSVNEMSNIGVEELNTYSLSKQRTFDTQLSQDQKAGQQSLIPNFHEMDKADFSDPKRKPLGVFMDLRPNDFQDEQDSHESSDSEQTNEALNKQGKMFEQQFFESHY